MRSIITSPIAFLLMIVLSGCAAHPSGQSWRLESLASVAGVTPEIVGQPKAVSIDGRPAFCFDGRSDGVFVPVNPIEGWPQFTIEVSFKPDGDGPAEQRFLHIQDEAERRVLIETRLTNERSWALDTFLHASAQDRLTLLDRSKSQPTDRWYWAALTYDGKTMRHFVDGRQQLEGEVAFVPMARGRISLGVRQNRIHWFKGCIAEVRFTPRALDSSHLRVP